MSKRSPKWATSNTPETKKREGHTQPRHLSPYRRLPYYEKQRQALSSLRADPVRCGACQMAIMPADIASHATRCPGSRVARDAEFAGKTETMICDVAGDRDTEGYELGA